MILFIKNCLSTEDMFKCLDAQAATVHEVLRDMKDELNDLPTLPADYFIENSNIQQLVLYIRAMKKNKIYLPYDPYQFAFQYANKLSTRNAEELMRISEGTDGI